VKSHDRPKREEELAPVEPKGWATHESNVILDKEKNEMEHDKLQEGVHKFPTMQKKGLAGEREL